MNIFKVFLKGFLKPKILQLEVTNDCFMNCRICMRRRSSRSIGYLSFEDFIRLPIKEFKEVAFHGWGEPLLHPRLFDMIKYAKKLGLRTSLITNGFLVDKHIEDILSSGLDELAVGIYTLKGRDKVLKNIELLLKNRDGSKPYIVFDITILRENLDEIPKIVDTASKLGIDAVVLHRLFYAHDPELQPPSRSDEERLFLTLSKLADKLGIRVYLPQYRRTRPCIVTLQCMFITWDCKYSPCCFLAEMGYLMGDAKRDNIFELHRKFLLRRSVNVCEKCPW